MILYLLLIAVPVLGLLALLLGGGKNKSGYSWLGFFARGKDAGFSMREIDLLRRVAIRAELEDPSALFWSVKQLDLCIKALLRKARLTGEERSKETQDFLSKLYDYRKKIEFDQPRYKKGITSSRSIAETQRLRVLVDGAGVFAATVVRNSDRFLTISIPVGPKLPASFTWKERRLSVYFWRRDDAGYVFDTLVLDDVEMRSTPVLQLAHSDSLFRTQKRKSVRTKTRISAYLYIPRGEEAPEKIEVEPGLRCIIEDLSEDGCSLTVGGRAVVGLRVKVQFELEGETVAMPGVVRSSDYSENDNLSLLHIESDVLSLATRNRILAAVFQVQPDAEFGAAYAMLDGIEKEIADQSSSDRDSADWASDPEPEPEFPMESQYDEADYTSDDDDPGSDDKEKPGDPSAGNARAVPKAGGTT
ncbi:MAG: pilus assembly protein PilZ [Treponema sp. GWB1_62_6]|nr:MAG: pilus assembly protein PilZ [Treponema sp. GWA1_62_8]OHE63729.1 MAG: pilus assembly protein PilZ [Treponema sp. GWC1_61_84]OHE69280.1 MAG: pilus assembly protein PilZ [Treponema sp. RIFOXYC1_FULL_61_9]OHE72139.1 MAG: pilus assembly protein PilZ [Treponema sp. GWB1_62_6]